MYNEKQICKEVTINKELVFYVILVLITVVLCAIRIHEGHSWGDDFSCYIMQAKSVLSGTIEKQVENNSFIVTNSGVILGPAAYPWGYPLTMCPVIKLFEDIYIPLKWEIAFFFIFILCVSYYVYSKKMVGRYAKLGTVLLMMSPGYLVMVNQILSDLPFVFFSICAIYSLDYMYKIKCNLKVAFVFAICTVLAWFTKSQGIVILLTMISVDIIYIIGRSVYQRLGIFFVKQKPGIHIFVYITIICCKLLEKKVFPTGEYGYSDFSIMHGIKPIYDRIIMELKAPRGLFGNTLHYTFLGGEFYPSELLAIVFSVVFIISFIHLWRNELPICIYLIGNLAMITLFPPWQGLRYFLPIIPWELLLCLEYFEKIKDSHGLWRRLYKYLNIVLVTTICICMISASVECVYANINKGQNYTDETQTNEAKELYTFIENNTSKNDIIGFIKPRALYLNTGRLGFAITEKNTERISDVDFLLFCISYEQKYLEEKIECYPGAKIVFQNKDFKLLKLK